jgi:hypothetical protein
VVTICPTSLTISNSAFLFVCFIWFPV